MTHITPVAVLLLTAAVAAAPVPKAAKKGPFYPHAVGTKWEYEHDGDAKDVWVEEVTDVSEKDGAVTFQVDITTSGGRKRAETYRLKDGVLELTATQNGVYDPPMLIAKAGMKAGDEWETSYGYAGGRAMAMTLTVGEAEELTTPAGKFTAFPVVRSTKGPNGNSATTFWFADGVGMIRQTSPDQDEPLQHLKAFTPGKK